MRTGGPQRGSAGLLLCGVVAVVAVLALGLGRLAGGTRAKAGAQTAADAAALAAAGELVAGRTPRDAERTASTTAAANGARPVSYTHLTLPTNREV